MVRRLRRLNEEDLESSGHGLAEVLSHHLLGGTKKNMKKYNTRLPVARPRFEPRTF
jgi:hypothetical protein